MMKDFLSIILMVSLLGIIVSVGAIIYSAISKRSSEKFVRAAIGSVILFIISTVGLLMS